MVLYHGDMAFLGDGMTEGSLHHDCFHRHICTHLQQRVLELGLAAYAQWDHCCFDEVGVC